LQAQVQACQQKVAASVADIRANHPPQVEDGTIVEEAIRQEMRIPCLSSIAGLSDFMVLCFLARDCTIIVNHVTNADKALQYLPSVVLMSLCHSVFILAKQ
jgi:hypothetical protein